MWFMAFTPTHIVTSSLKTIPEVDTIVNAAIERLRESSILTPEKVKSNFSDALSTLEKTAEIVYREYEHKALENLKQKCLERIGIDVTPKQALDSAILLVKEFELRAGQSRKSRAGHTFEKAVPLLLQKMLIQCEKPTGKDARKIFRQVDLIAPSVQVAKEKPEQAIYISVKRTLRERWKQVVDEKILGYVYLITNTTETKDLTESKCETIGKQKIILYVQDKVKKLDYLKDKPFVRTLNDLPKDLERFKKTG